MNSCYTAPSDILLTANLTTTTPSSHTLWRSIRFMRKCTWNKMTDRRRVVVITWKGSLYHEHNTPLVFRLSGPTCTTVLSHGLVIGTVHGHTWSIVLITQFCIGRVHKPTWSIVLITRFCIGRVHRPTSSIVLITQFYHVFSVCKKVVMQSWSFFLWIYNRNTWENSFIGVQGMSLYTTALTVIVFFSIK